MGTVYVVAFFIAAAAVGGSVFGFRASMRDTSHATAGTGVDDLQSLDAATPARPIVDVTPMAAPPPEAAATNTLADATNAVTKRTEEAATNDVAVRTAAVQAQQNNPARPAQDIDTLLTSQSERPQTPAKPSTDDQPAQTTGQPAKNDVPF
jgi:hypothetical protein